MKKREKRKIKTRPLPESKVNNFCAELTKHKWAEVKTAENVNDKVEIFHKYIATLLCRYN